VSILQLNGIYDHETKLKLKWQTIDLGNS